MTGIFITVLNMSIIATCAAIIVMIARLLMKKAPKLFSYVLWFVVLFRLVCPFSFESVISLLPVSNTTLPQEITSMQAPEINSGLDFIDNAVNQSIAPMAPLNNGSSVDPMYVVMSILSNLWIIGLIVMLCYGSYTYFRLKGRLLEATLVRNNIYETDRIHSPFVLGFVNPKIYIPIGISGDELEYVLLHEQIHISRRDYIIKPVAFLALAIHWFNPVIWLSFILMNKDMELSCDESIMKKSENDIRAGYSHSLLSFSEKQSRLISPSAFGEGNVKVRIKNILAYRKPKRKTVIIAVATVAVIAACCITNPVSAVKQSGTGGENTISPRQIEYELNMNTPEYHKQLSAVITSVETRIANGEITPELIMKQSDTDSKAYGLYSNKTDLFATNGEVAPHVLFNGEIGLIYDSYENTSWYLQKGGEIIIHIYSDKEYYGSTGNVEAGYVKDGKIKSAERFAVSGKDNVSIQIPEDSEYQFYIACISSDPILMNGVLIEYQYPRNKNGQTYGPDSTLSMQPDLIQAMGIDGTIGYVLAKDLNGEMPRTPEEAIKQQKSNEGGYKIPLYDVNGETIIGEFIVGG